MIKYLALILSTILVTGCSFETVEPTQKGKILTTAGYQPDILEPGKYTTWGRDQLVTIDASTNTYKEQIRVVLTDKLSLGVEVRFRGRLNGDKSTLNRMFSDIDVGDDHNLTFAEVYNVYGQMVVRNKVREIVSQYNADEVHQNYARLSSEVGQAILAGLEGTPLEVSDLAFGDIGYPEVILKAVADAKERELSIAKEQAQAEIELTKKKNERLLAEADYQVEITRAKAVRDKNNIIGEGVTPELIELRRLDVLLEMAKNERAVFMPVEAMTSVGAQTRMFAKND